MKDGICLGDHIRANATQDFLLALRCHALSLTEARNNYNINNYILIVSTLVSLLLIATAL
eukprot:6482097-Amphidinium_carterae.1